MSDERDTAPDPAAPDSGVPDSGVPDPGVPDPGAPSEASTADAPGQQAPAGGPGDQRGDQRGDQPEDQAAPPYQILRQYIKDFSFEAPNAPAIFAAAGEPETRVALDVRTQSLGGRDVEVVLAVEVKAEQDGRTAYLMELSYGAAVRVGQVPREALNALLLVEVPRMLFPFLREIVGNATRDGGFSMLLLAPFDFVRLYRTRMAQEQQAAQTGADTADGDSKTA